MKFVRCTNGGQGGPVLVPLDKLLIVFDNNGAGLPSFFYAWTVGKDGHLTQVKYTCCDATGGGTPDLRDCLVEV